MRYKIFAIIVWTGLIAFMIGAGVAHAGPYIDLDIGTNLTEDHNRMPDGAILLSDEDPVGQIRIGYQTEAYKLFGPVDIRAHGYWQHRSSVARTDDSGFNLLMFGIRLE